MPTFIICPDCGATGQEVGKYCENCGRFLTEADAQAPMSGATGTVPAPPATPPPWDPAPARQNPQGTVAPGQAGAHFAVVRNGRANPSEGFTIAQAGEFLVGRPNAEMGTGVDVDLRQWVQPMIFDGQKQYLVHRNQCFLGLDAEGTVTIRPCPGAEIDTLVKPAGGTAFVALESFGTVRAARPDSAFPLQPGDQIYMGDPTAVTYFQSGDPTAQGTYLVLELLPS
jgi:hypothetical protein